MEISFKAPRLKAGSVLWLAVQDFKRSFRTKKNNSGAKALIGRLIFFAFMLFVFYSAGQGFYLTLLKGKLPIEVMEIAAGQKIFTMFIALFFMSMMTSFMTLTDRGDLDLLLSAPIEAKNIIIARLLVGSWRTIMIFWLFGTMFIGLSAVLVSPKYFSYLPTAIGMALAEAGLTFLAARYCLKSMGLRNGRIFVQIIGFVGIFGGVFLTQINAQNSARNYSKENLLNASANFPDALKDFYAFLGRSILGDWGVAFLFLAIGAAIFFCIALIFGSTFAKDAAWLSGQSDEGAKKKNPELTVNFKGNFAKTILFKELRGIIRDQTAIVQFVAPLAGILPAMFALLSVKNGQSDLMGYIASPLVVFLSASMSASLAWMIVSVEEANELLKSSPIALAKIYTYKAVFALMPAFIEFSLFAIGIAFFTLKGAILTFIFSLLANISIIAIEFANPKPTRRPKMMQKPDRSITSIIIGLVAIMFWSIASSVAYYSLLWSIIPIILALIIVAWSMMFNKNDETNHAKAIWAQNTAM